MRVLALPIVVSVGLMFFIPGCFLSFPKVDQSGFTCSGDAGCAKGYSCINGLCQRDGQAGGDTQGGDPAAGDPGPVGFQIVAPQFGGEVHEAASASFTVRGMFRSYGAFVTLNDGRGASTSANFQIVAPLE